MSDRLHDLQRQRALAQEQVAWLDREIAAEIAKSGTTPATAQLATPSHPASPTPAALASAARRATNTVESALPADAEKILAEYQTSPSSIKNDVKRGCFLYLAFAFALLAASLVALYLHSRSK